jgi:hypothetical protein
MTEEQTAMNAEAPDPLPLTEKRKFQVEEAVLILLLVLSLVGNGVTDFSPADGYWYWMAMIVVFYLAAVLIGWIQSKHHFGDFKQLFLEQLFHWAASMLSVGATFSLLHAGQLTMVNTGLVIMLILSLATILDGLRVGWRFSMNGVFLGASAVISAYVTRPIWIEVLLALGIVVFTILVEHWRERRGSV